MSRAFRSLRIRLALLAMLACALLAIGASAAYAAPGTAGTISGTVRNEALTAGLPYAGVDIYYDFGYGWNLWDAFLTDGTGQYAYDVPAGTYKVGFWYGGGQYEYYNEVADIADADLVVIPDEGGSVPNVDGSLAETGFSIGGTVSGSDGNAVGWASVTLYVFDGNDWVYTDSTTADGLGHYVFANLPGGDFRLEFQDYSIGVYTGEFYNDAPDILSATTVQVNPDTMEVRDVVLQAPPFISGHVSDASTNDPLSWIEADAYQFDGESGWYYSQWGQTGPDGDYSILGVEPGVEYFIYFYDTNYSYGDQWYDGQAWMGQATGVTATADGVTGINATLLPWDSNYGAVNGTVYDTDTSEPIPYAGVDFYYDNGYGWEWWDYTTADEFGFYYYDLWYGTYVAEFSDYDHVTGYSGGASDIESATPFDVGRLGDVTSGVDGWLVPLSAVTGTISGRVIDDSTDRPVENVGVDFFDQYGNWVDATVWTDWLGRYSVNLLPGTYYVNFWDDQGRFFAEFFDNQTEGYLATPVEVTTGVNTPVNAGLTPNYGSLAGKITADDGLGTPLESVDLIAWVSDGEGGYVDISYTSTDENGDYEFKMLGANDYRIQVKDWSGRYLSEFWNDQPDLEFADAVTVSAGATLTGYNAVLTPADPSITGTVYDAADNPLIDIGVLALSYDETEQVWYWVTDAYTDEFGEYDLYGLDPGDYAILFSDWSYSYKSQFYNGQSDIEEADLVPYDGTTTVSGIDAHLVEGGLGTIQGAITSEATNNGIPYASVDIYFAGFEDWEIWEFAEADETGFYSIDLPPSSYRLGFYDGEGEYLPEYYDDASDIWLATDVAVEAGAVATADAALAKAGSISGVVTGASGALADIAVSAYYADFEGTYYPWTMSWTGPDGSYTIGQLPAGDYKVEFADWDTGRALGEWYNDKPDLDSANVVHIAAAQKVTGINAALATAGRVTGTVTDAADAPIGDIGVDVLADDGEGGFTWMSGGYTDERGNYYAGGLPGGSYYVYFYDSYWAGERYASEYYNDSPDPEGAGTVDVVVGADTDVDAQLSEQGGFGSISGTVRDESNSAAIGEAWVDLFAPMEWGWDYYDETYTDANGAYVFNWVPEGYYIVGAGVWTGAYEDGFATNASDMDSADILELTPVGGLDAVDVYLTQTTEAAHISGVVRTEADLAIAGATVTAYELIVDPDEGEWMAAVGSTVTNEFGSYEMAVTAGDYKLRFSAPGYATEWFDDATTEYDATLFTLEASGNYTADANLGTAGSISGVIGGTAPGSYAYAELFRLVGEEYKSVAWIDAESDGSYSFAGLAAGTYKVRFFAWDEDSVYAEQWYDTADFEAEAQPIVLGTAENKTGINATMVEGVSITGVLDSDDGKPVDDVIVKLWRLNGADWEIFDATGAWMRRFEFFGLPAGTYKVGFIDPNEHYADVYYSNALSLGTAQSFVLAPGQEAVANQKLDALAPVVTDDVKASYVAPAYIQLSATDAGIGVKEIRYSVDGVIATQTVSGASAKVTVSKAGTQTLRYEAVDKLGHVSTGVRKTFVVNPGSMVYKPLQGDNRYETCVKVSQQAFSTPPASGTVIIATGLNWPDALGGAALAKAYGAPILLVTQAAVPPAIGTEIVRLKATKAVILGGTASVSKSVEAGLKAKGIKTIERIGGSNRYDTSRKVAAEVARVMGGSFPHRAFVATGGNFADALAASPISAKLGWPIYLVGDTLTSADSGAMKAIGVTDITILGGTGAVKPAVQTSLEAGFGKTHVERVFGTTRYATAVKVAAYGIGLNKGLGWDKLALATGTNFPDALAGGVLQGRSGSVMLLTPTASLDPNVESVLKAYKSGIYEVRFLGGTGAISNAVRTKVQAILKK